MDDHIDEAIEDNVDSIPQGQDDQDLRTSANQSDGDQAIVFKRPIHVAEPGKSTKFDKKPKSGKTKTKVVSSSDAKDLIHKYKSAGGKGYSIAWDQDHKTPKKAAFLIG